VVALEQTTLREPSLGEVITIGLDIAKSVFQVHGIDVAGAVVIRKRVTRAKVLEYFGELPPCLVGIEACPSAHHWGRELQGLGHTVRLIPPSYVKAYLKRGKNDANDAAAICEAVTRPSMRFVPIKTQQQQTALMLHRARKLLVRQRATNCVPNSSEPLGCPILGRGGRYEAARFHSGFRQRSGVVAAYSTRPAGRAGTPCRCAHELGSGRFRSQCADFCAPTQPSRAGLG